MPWLQAPTYHSENNNMKENWAMLIYDGEH